MPALRYADFHTSPAGRWMSQRHDRFARLLASHGRTREQRSCGCSASQHCWRESNCKVRSRLRTFGNDTLGEQPRSPPASRRHGPPSYGRATRADLAIIRDRLGAKIGEQNDMLDGHASYSGHRFGTFLDNGRWIERSTQPCHAHDDEQRPRNSHGDSELE
jgi:hypothetical protein